MRKYLETLKEIIKTELFFFTSLFIFIIWLFRNAFSMNFFSDDYYFLRISWINNIGDFINFFSPLKGTFYRPLSSEVFYFVLHLFKTNVFINHLIVFLFYFIGLVYLYKIIKLLSKNTTLAKLTVFLYGISFIHVFQLYWFATFQEIAVFTFLCLSFYYLLTNKKFLSVIFFITALMSKEIALAYVPFLWLFNFIQNKQLKKSRIIELIIFTGIGLIFLFLYKNGLSQTTSLQNYQIKSNLKLPLNNFMWYSLWSLGLPNFMSDYFRSIFSTPLPAFWEILKILNVKTYLIVLLTYLLLFFSTISIFLFNNGKQFNKIFYITILSILGYVIFISPVLLFTHKWMIRLTLPLIFILLLEAYLLIKMWKNNSIFKTITIMLLILYCLWNYFGIKTHESSSLYSLENDIYKKSRIYFAKNKNEIIKHKFIYINDNESNKNDIYKNSQKLKSSFHDQDFIDHFFPKKTIKVIYNFENTKIPNDSYIFDTHLFFK